MLDDTQEKIIKATMELVMEKGYSNTTTKDIARRAGINECTIFRKFKGKKEIILAAMEKPEWNPDLKPEDFEGYSGDMLGDLTRFSEVYIAEGNAQNGKGIYRTSYAGIISVYCKGDFEDSSDLQEGIKRIFCGDEGTRKDPAGRSGGTGNDVLVHEFWVRILEGIFRL